MTLTVGSLFSGIGGLDLGLERAGMRVIWQSEIDPYACRVLKKHWPEVPNHGDIKRIEWANIVRPDVICGGYPCQPFSTAGKRQGEEDPRHLWPWVRHAISVLRPRYAILENVRGHLSLGGASVLSEIAALGYSAEWRVISAASVGANHRRDRVIIVAYPNRQNESDVSIYGGRQELALARPGRRGATLADPDGSNPTDGRERQALPSEDRSRGNDRGGSYGDPWEVTVRGTRKDSGHVENADGRRFEERQSDPQEIWVASSASQLAGYCGAEWWETEPGMGRVANGIPHRVDRLKGLGNAVVPQVAEVIGRLVIAHNQREAR